MKMARASEADMECALEVSRILEDLEKGYMPSADEDEGIEWFDQDNGEQCKRALGKLLEASRRGSIFRVTFGMTVLLDPRNELMDPDADTLEKHPKIIAALAAPPQPVAADGVTDGWPKLDSPASIGGGSFGKGVSSRLLVEAAQRKYEFEAEDSARTQEQRVKEEMNRRAMWDFVHGPIPAISKRESGK